MVTPPLGFSGDITCPLEGKPCPQTVPGGVDVGVGSVTAAAAVVRARLRPPGHVSDLEVLVHNRIVMTNKPKAVLWAWSRR
jgi:hypothetical protein